MKTSMGSPTAALGLLAAGALVLSACGGGESEAGTDDEIASLEDATGDDDTVAAETNDGASVDDVEQVALDFSACLRGEGVDIPDIGVDADGNINLRDAMQSAEIDRETMRGAMEACGEILEGVGFGGGQRGRIADNPEIADAFLDYSDCIRGQGFEDVTDLTFGGPGQNADEAPGQGEGQRQGGFGDRNARFADQLGLDAEDPEVAAALETCQPIIDQAFTDAGIAAPGGGNG